MPSVIVMAGLLLYFGAASLALGLCMLPSWRDRARAGLLRLAAPRGAAAAGAGVDAREPGAVGGRRAPRQAAVALLSAVAVSAGPTAAVLLQQRLPEPAHPVDASAWRDARVDAEELASPVTAPLAAPLAGPAAGRATRADPAVIDPPAPAEATTTPTDDATSRDWSLLDPRFGERLLAVFEIARRRHGYELVLLEGWRSPQRQAELAALGPARTRAGPHRSRHQAGLAADVAFRRDGRLVVSEQDPWAMQAYRHYGDIARSVGLEWGGDWSSPKDLGHVELRVAGQAAPGAEPGARLLASR